MSSRTVGIFVATMTGTAEMCADEIAAALESRGARVKRQLMDGLSARDLTGFDYVVIISSTYGHGDVPDNGQALYASVEAAPTLAGVRYAVFGLGDMTYAATFCEGGKKWDALLARKQATRVAPQLQHDAASGTLAEDVAAEWALNWSAILMAAA